MSDYEREANALKVAAEWEAHRAMDRREREQSSRRSKFILALGIALWIGVFMMLFERL